jgi:hypothetical protein
MPLSLWRNTSVYKLCLLVHTLPVEHHPMNHMEVVSLSYATVLVDLDQNHLRSEHVV